MNGVILLNKPLGRTSHDMVYEIRRLTGIKKVGHTGTLDPMAEGVLPICIGSATKAADMLTATTKRYRAELILGLTTDTQDAQGTVLTECGYSCTEQEIREAVASFVGEIEQVPPMYSALKQNGRRLYELARQGQVILRPARKITIYDIEVLAIDLARGSVVIEVSCSKGTYIRTLCEDIGLRLGAGAYMNTLVRIKSGGFDIQNCYTLQELYAMRDMGRLLEAVIPVEDLFEDCPKVTLNQKQSGHAVNGVAVSAPGIEEGVRYRVYDWQGFFLCLSRCVEGRLKLEKAFWQ